MKKLKEFLVCSFRPPKILSTLFLNSPKETTASHYLKLIENILIDSNKSDLEKQKILQNILKLITNKIQIYYNETVLFHGKFEEGKELESNCRTYQFDDILPFAYTECPNSYFSINETPCFSFIWRSDKILNNFSRIGQEKFDFQKQDEPINILVYPLGIVICIGNNHSTNAGLLGNSGKSQINHKMTLTLEQISDIFKNPQSEFSCRETKLLLEIAQLFLDYNFNINVT